MLRRGEAEVGSPAAHRRRAVWVAAVAIAAAMTLGVGGCVAGGAGSGGAAGSAGGGAGSSGAEGSGSAVVGLPAGAVFDYQLGGGYAPADGVTVVVRDSTDEPADGLYDVCYVNAFQTQPGAEWPDELVLHDSSGAEVFDPGWPDERILDISSEANRAAIAEKQAATIAGCAADGFDAVEFDNLDSYLRSDGAFDLEAGVAFAGLLVGAAHANGLAAGQKNTPELAERGRAEIGFDFAVAEQCALYEECAAYTDVYGDQVLDIEYVEDLEGDYASDFAAVCDDAQTPPATILRDLDLTPTGSEGHVYERC